MLIYKKGNIFSYKDIDNKGVLVHAVNCVGVWGAGVAKQAAFNFPCAYDRYKLLCQTYGKRLLGRGIVIEHHEQRVGCLFTSHNYGAKKDSTSDILKNTKTAIEELLKAAYAFNPHKVEIHSPKFNSGLFGVPWEQTEAILKKALEKYDDLSIIWTVWEL